MKTVTTIVAVLLGALLGVGAAQGKAEEPATAVASCPCSGSKVCVGPRGGRYCITSGGKKRYLK